MWNRHQLKINWEIWHQHRNAYGSTQQVHATRISRIMYYILSMHFQKYKWKEKKKTRKMEIVWSNLTDLYAKRNFLRILIWVKWLRTEESHHKISIYVNHHFACLDFIDLLKHSTTRYDMKSIYKKLHSICPLFVFHIWSVIQRIQCKRQIEKNFESD